MLFCTQNAYLVRLAWWLFIPIKGWSSKEGRKVKETLYLAGSKCSCQTQTCMGLFVIHSSILWPQLMFNVPNVLSWLDSQNSFFRVLYLPCYIVTILVACMLDLSILLSNYSANQPAVFQFIVPLKHTAELCHVTSSLLRAIRKYVKNFPMDRDTL